MCVKSVDGQVSLKETKFSEELLRNEIACLVFLSILLTVSEKS